MTGRVPSPHGAHLAPSHLPQVTGLAWEGSELGLFPAPSLLPGISQGLLLAPWDVCHISWWEMAQVVLATTFLLLLLPPMARDLRGCIHEDTVPCCAMPCAKQDSLGLIAQHGAVQDHTRTERCGAEPNLLLPSPHPSQCSILDAGQTPARGSLWGRRARREGRDGAAFLQIKASGLSHV